MRKVLLIFATVILWVFIAQECDKDKVGMYGPKKSYQADDSPYEPYRIPQVADTTPKKTGKYNLGPKEVETIPNN